ncbi:hypothetical protein EYF80_038151 [Liparis tanakae]|uniref:Uncharacterized protein n=1 Tax=Liparis tanakae TaxID=230148 RepID=A0A4Z2GEP2_9TELE|nr:hypothetical protein EYF80_038151 [Liparis tanakae]
MKTTCSAAACCLLFKGYVVLIGWMLSLWFSVLLLNRHATGWDYVNVIIPDFRMKTPLNKQRLGEHHPLPARGCRRRYQHETGISDRPGNINLETVTKRRDAGEEEEEEEEEGNRNNGSLWGEKTGPVAEVPEDHQPHDGQLH